MTYRDRRLAKADRLREWAGKREQKAADAWAKAERMASVIPFGQPILIGHHSERGDRRYRARISSAFDRAAADAVHADQMARRADHIEAQVERAIYDDDPDAIERLAARIAALEELRDSIKASNAQARKDGQPAPRMSSNLSADIRRNKERLARLQSPAPPRPRLLHALRRPAVCAACGTALPIGASAWWIKDTGALFCRSDMAAASAAL